MSLSMRRSLGVAAAAAAALVATTTPALAATTTAESATINRTDCNRNDYLEIHNNGGRDTLCFANAGEVPVAIYGVNWVESGNNAVTFQFQRNLNDPRLETVTLNKWSQWGPGQASIHKIIWIKIY
ncbi:beta/gamma crystallin domain-containing protein [Kitasatospora sp. CM 4170]|uniref:Beta/gamma crystallin domain-containing protein n=1 Tax=Kitasatospora aburaviensis TaxID=67265 RepID=A0ABW1EU37_9ACTN|nr:beta/gamma crystallin domain-containing protein [Kitasatospora sp. CM 4170]WNM43729.1 beta/gamma crystallin domain-containing protein [Kitasatospora sp. CM 4170]